MKTANARLVLFLGVLVCASAGRGVATAQCPHTPANPEGPYFKPGSPLKSDFRPDAETDTWIHHVIRGTVNGTDCAPIANAKLDFWHTNELGQYDNSGYKMRGHIFTDACGEYHLDTVVPGLYPGRTRHVHVKVTTPDGLLLTTQLYYPDEPGNFRDPLYLPDLEMHLTKTEDLWDGVFHFVLNTAGNAPDCNSCGRIRKARCRTLDGNSVLTIRLASGLSRDGFTLTLSDGTTYSGVLNRKGKARVDFDRASGDAGFVSATWGCGETDERTYACP